MPEAFVPPGPCPVCGDYVPAKATACPGCGACPDTGWSEQAAYDALDLPDSEFDHADFVRRESEDNQLPARRRWLAAVAAFLLLAWLLWWILA